LKWKLSGKNEKNRENSDVLIVKNKLSIARIYKMKKTIIRIENYHLLRINKSSITRIYEMWRPRISILQYVIDKDILLRICEENRHELLTDDMIEDLLFAGVDMNYQDIFGNTALIWAARKGNRKSLEILCKLPKIDVNMRNNSGNTAFTLARRYRRYECVDALCGIDGINVNESKYSYTILMSATNEGDEKNVEMILRVKGIDVNAKNQWGDTVLTMAVRRGHEKIVEMLLQMDGIDVNAKDGYEGTALMTAANRDNEKIVGMLLQMDGINVNAENIYKNTALMIATSCGHEKIVEMLKRKIETKNKKINSYQDACVRT
jgi:ankyrin repeat protein